MIEDISGNARITPLRLSAWWALFGSQVGIMAAVVYTAPPTPPPRAATTCVEIYVGNLSYDMTEAQLRKEFERFGTVKSARIIENRFNHKSKGLRLYRDAQPHRGRGGHQGDTRQGQPDSPVWTGST